MKAIDLSNKSLFTCSPEALVQDIVEIMVQANIGAVVVTYHDKVQGIFSERDLLKRVVGEKKSPATTRISSVMTAPVVTVGTHTSMNEALTLMKQGNFRHLPVVDNKHHLVGMISIRDLVFAIDNEDAFKKAS